MGLYRSLMGRAWDDLGPALRRLHAGDGAGAVDIRLEILPDADGERWVRHFGDVRDALGGVIAAEMAWRRRQPPLSSAIRRSARSAFEVVTG